MAHGGHTVMNLTFWTKFQDNRLLSSMTIRGHLAKMILLPGLNSNSRTSPHSVCRRGGLSLNTTYLLRKVCLHANPKTSLFSNMWLFQGLKGKSQVSEQPKEIEIPKLNCILRKFTFDLKDSRALNTPQVLPFVNISLDSNFHSRKKSP